MKVSREEAAANRKRIVEVASQLFREKGFDGIGVADLMKSAGMTHGGFYGHFKSKDHLAEEACGSAADRAVERWTKVAKEGGNAFAALVKNYLSEERVTTPASSCMFAALGSDAARQGKQVRRVFADGFERLIDVLADAAPGRTKAEKRRRATASFAEMVGAMVLARAVGDPELGSEILRTAAADVLAKRGKK
jgi:TetR/AcrR family transcriptional repressor of nem operon